jgi:hypothetical protein
MERLLAAAVWGVAAAAVFGAAGALFGAVARVVVPRRYTARDRTRGQAAADGARGGAALLAAFGFLAGVAVGGMDLPPDARFQTLTTLFIAAVLLMTAAVAFGAFASFLEWLLGSGKPSQSRAGEDDGPDGA